MAKNNPIYTDEALFSLVIYNKKVRSAVERLLAQYEQSIRFATVSELEFDIRFLRAILSYRVGGALPKSDDIASAIGISNASGTTFKKALIEKIFATIDEEKILVPVYEQE